MKTQSFTLSFAPSPRSEASPTQFEGVAYSGGVIPGHGWLGDIAIDLSSFQFPDKPLFALVNHDPDQRAGKCSVFNSGQELIVNGVFSEVTEAGKTVAAEFAEGAPWQFSVGIKAEIEYFDDPTEMTVNGRTVRISALMKKARILEVSFVPAGADPNTKVIAFANDSRSQREDLLMDGKDVQIKLEAANQLIIDLQSKINAAEIEHGKAIASLEHSLKEECKRSLDFSVRAEAAENEINTIRLANRVASVKRLFSEIHREYDEVTAKPYIELTDAAFALLESDLKSFKPTVQKDWFQDTTRNGKESVSEMTLNAKLFNQVSDKAKE